MSRFLLSFCGLLIAIGVCGSAIAQEDTGAVKATGDKHASATEDAIAEIEAAVESYLNSFRAKDVDALVKHWTAEGVYVNRTSEERTAGHADLRAQFEQHFSSDVAFELDLQTESIDLVSPNVAIERGLATVLVEQAESVQMTYQVVYLKQEGRWLIDRVTEEEIERTPEGILQLQRLEWLVGDWIDADEQTAVEFSCDWTENKSYLYRKYKVISEGDVDSSGLQIIGWNAATKEINSWLFDSDGGFVKGIWLERDGRWTVSSVATLNNGSQGSFVSVYTPQDDGTYRWKKINRVLDGTLLPSLDETVVRPR
ncbi:DUF4440 domain-containing protein [Roseiconus lacunae]|uniref:YybH family protein n=1 Tax=Roseiconus lacunae TaxID=2605694 RepID=UPI00308D353B|nr:DUF4440 domain-containing protein [Stieleria sp. HD01]